MDRDEIIDLLTIVQASDQRTVGDPEIKVWHELLGRYDRDDCVDAIMWHRRERPGVWLEPGHVVARVRAVIQDRYERADVDDRPHSTGIDGVRRDRYGEIDKSAPDEDDYPSEWTSEQRVAAYWEKIRARRNDFNPPAGETVRGEAMAHIRDILGKSGVR
jgi:hypothetical protein